MNNTKDQRQIEFLDLRKFLREHGYTDTAISEATGKTKGMVSKWLNDPEKIPPESVLILMRRIVKEIEARIGEKYPSRSETSVGMEEPDVRAAANKLGEIHRADPEKFRTVTEMIEIVHEKTKPKTPSSSVPSDIGARVSRAEPSPENQVNYRRRRSSSK